MPPTSRRTTPSYQPPASPAPSAAPAPSVMTAGASAGEPPRNTLQPEWIYAEGMNGHDALVYVLGDQVTGDNQDDCQAAMARIDEWVRLIPTLRSVILHVMYNNYARREDQPEADRWLWVGQQLRRPKSTVATWAHQVECHDTVPNE